jgi:hypothetical protein
VATATPEQRTWVELHESQPTHGVAVTGDPVEGVDTVEADQATRPSTRRSASPW